MSYTKQKQKVNVSPQASYFIHVTIPVALFLMTVCLRVPIFLRSLLVSSLGGANVHQTLTSAQRGLQLANDDRHKLYSDLARSTASSLRSRPWVSGAVYIIYKLLLVLAAITIAVTINRTLLPNVENLKTVSMAPKMDYRSSEDVNALNEKDELHSETNTSARSIEVTPFGIVCHCYYTIRQLQNAHDYTVQCLFTPDEDNKGSTPDIAASSLTSKGNENVVQDAPVYDIYEALLLILQAYMIALSVAGVFSLLFWVSTLAFGACRKNVPLDTVLLLQMAKINVGPDVVEVFSQSDLPSLLSKQEHIALQE